MGYHFSQKTIFPIIVYYHYSVWGGSASTTNKEGTHNFLKLPQSKFWCPGCAPAAEKFWRRHCSTVCPVLEQKLTDSLKVSLWGHEVKSHHGRKASQSLGTKCVITDKRIITDKWMAATQSSNLSKVKLTRLALCSLLFVCGTMEDHRKFTIDICLSVPCSTANSLCHFEIIRSKVKVTRSSLLLSICLLVLWYIL